MLDGTDNTLAALEGNGLVPTVNSHNGSGYYYAQVSDTRTGGLGWNLQVGATPFSTSDNKKSLANTSLKITPDDVKNSTDDTTANAANYTMQGVNLTPASTASQPLLTVKSGVGAGNGSTSLNFTANDILLQVPAASLNSVVNGETYTSTLTWTLASTAQ